MLEFPIQLLSKKYTKNQKHYLYIKMQIYM